MTDASIEKYERFAENSRSTTLETWRFNNTRPIVRGFGPDGRVRPKNCNFYKPVAADGRPFPHVLCRPFTCTYRPQNWPGTVAICKFYISPPDYFLFCWSDFSVLFQVSGLWNGRCDGLFGVMVLFY